MQFSNVNLYSRKTFHDTIKDMNSLEFQSLIKKGTSDDRKYVQKILKDYLAYGEKQGFIKISYNKINGAIAFPANCGCLKQFLR